MSLWWTLFRENFSGKANIVSFNLVREKTKLKPTTVAGDVESLASSLADTTVPPPLLENIAPPCQTSIDPPLPNALDHRRFVYTCMAWGTEANQPLAIIMVEMQKYNNMNSRKQKSTILLSRKQTTKASNNILTWRFFIQFIIGILFILLFFIFLLFFILSFLFVIFIIIQFHHSFKCRS